MRKRQSAGGTACSNWGRQLCNVELKRTRTLPRAQRTLQYLGAEPRFRAFSNGEGKSPPEFRKNAPN